jgi:hypothetical protein
MKEAYTQHTSASACFLYVSFNTSLTSSLSNVWTPIQRYFQRVTRREFTNQDQYMTLHFSFSEHRNLIALNK